MGLDFWIEKKRKGNAYSTLAWENAHEPWRNCHTVKRIFCETIETNDTYIYPITIGAMQVIVKKLSEELQEEDFNDIENIDYSYTRKLLIAIKDLCTIINDEIWNNKQGIEYDYRVIDDF
ncbi:MAG: hypothetical protein IKJ73_04525 [Lachnospiraceae bacterium]|nr:hypothetical protein [Lachnospiraceae bacterium]